MKKSWQIVSIVVAVVALVFTIWQTLLSRKSTRHDLDEMNIFFDKLESIFRKDDFTKAEVVDAIKEFIPNFQHEEKGVNLDQKM